MDIRSRGRPVSVVVVLATLLGVWGCGDDGPAGPETGEATFIGTWDGDVWEGEASAAYGAAGDTLYIHGSNPVGARWNAASIVRIRIRYEGTGTYELGRDDGVFMRLVGGDVVVGHYVTMGGGAGSMTVFEGADGRILGVVRFEATDVSGPSPDPSIFRFEGAFQATILD